MPSPFTKLPWQQGKKLAVAGRHRGAAAAAESHRPCCRQCVGRITQTIALNRGILLYSPCTVPQMETVPLLVCKTLGRVTLKTVPPQGTLPAVASHCCMACYILSHEVYEYSFN